MSQTRSMVKIALAHETLEGAGVRLHRAFGYRELPLFDPFLMLDDFRAERPEDYLAGFPWHPHRGIETVTYMLEGTIEHSDSLGHSGNVDAECVQWMTAGSGIIHQEMPRPVNSRMGGFQLWVNLPRRFKMMDPRYQEIRAEEIPDVALPGGTSVKVICGTVAGISGPVKDILAEPEYLDVSVTPSGVFSHAIKPGYLAAAYVFGGSGWFDHAGGRELSDRAMVLFDHEGEAIDVHAGKDGVRFLFFSGKPLREPIAWGGPIVMNTKGGLRQAFSDYENNTFIKRR